MVFLRIALLSFWMYYAWNMGHLPETNAFGTFVAMSFFITAPVLYLLPTFEAWKQKHPNLTAIALVNIFLGWSLLGWVVALVWAYRRPEPVALASAPDAPVIERNTKTCPFCAEEILAAAVKCKHCGSVI